MINLAISLLVALGVFGIFVAFFSWYASLLPALIAFVATYLVLAQRAFRQVQALSAEAQKAASGGRIDRAVEVLRSGFPLQKKQFLVGSLLHSNLGTLLYMKRDFEGARPHLEKGYARDYFSRSMLGAYFYKKKQYDEMVKAFETAVKYGKKDPMIWCVYAWCLEHAGKRQEAMQVLGRGVQANPTDERIKSNLLALQNGKRMKMKGFAPQFYLFHLEAPPPDMGGRRVVYQRR